MAVNCKDTKIAVSVRTNRPFNGRIYALGRSETCNVDVINSDLFRLDLTMTGQDCNTQSVVSVPEYITIQIFRFDMGMYKSSTIVWSIYDRQSE